MRLAELKQRVADGQFEYVHRQSISRSMCRTPFGDGFIYFVLNRQTKSIITILDEDQLS
jgi:hypothetical protein